MPGRPSKISTFPIVILTIFCGLAFMGANLKKDEEVIIFPAYAATQPDGKVWNTQIHAWVFEIEPASLWRKGTLALLAKSLGLSAQDEENKFFRDRAQYFLADNEGRKRLSIEIGGSIFQLNPTKSNGHSQTVLELHHPPAAPLNAPGKIALQTLPHPPDTRRFQGELFFLTAAGLSVVSDIDDTIKISNVRQRDELLANTFLRQFQAVPGMAEHYRSWAAEGADFHYISASPWQLYPALRQFFKQENFPDGTFHLKQFRWKDRSFFDLFKPGEQTKRQACEDLLRTFPQRKFVFVGDSGEGDPELYSSLAQAYPSQVHRIFIRETRGDDNVEKIRLGRVSASLPHGLWQVFKDADELPQALNMSGN